jgi:hypothetical protein
VHGAPAIWRDRSLARAADCRVDRYTDIRELAQALQRWSEQSDDFPAAYRFRDDNTDRITGVQFNSRIPPLQNPEVPPESERWGREGP